MKKYLSFHLKGEDIFSYFIIIVLITVIPAIILSLEANRQHLENPGLGLILILSLGGLTILITVLILSLYILRQSIEYLEFDNFRFSFSGTSDTYLQVIFRGILLTIITLGIYAPWFQRDLMAFYVGKSSYKEKSFSFLGKGKDLLVLIIVALLIPMGILALIFGWESYNEHAYSSFKSYGLSLLQTIITAPFSYFYYRWFIDISYGEQQAKLEADHMEGIGVVLVQTILAVITFGIYFPVAGLKIYRYLLRNVRINGESGENIRFDYDMEDTQDFLFIWGQTLLTLITIGVYLPWAYCRVMERVLGKTSVAMEG